VQVRRPTVGLLGSFQLSRWHIRRLKSSDKKQQDPALYPG